jgi:hypothetical protein
VSLRRKFSSREQYDYIIEKRSKFIHIVPEVLLAGALGANSHQVQQNLSLSRPSCQAAGVTGTHAGDWMLVWGSPFLPPPRRPGSLTCALARITC